MGSLVEEEDILALLSDGLQSEDLIPVLQRIQAHFGYLPRLALEKVAIKLGLSLSRVYGVATFYSQFRLTPRGKHQIKVCHGTACHVSNAVQLESKIRQSLNLKDNEELTVDGEYSVEQVACLGCCGLAPVWSLDDKLYGAEQSRQIEKILSSKQKS